MTDATIKLAASIIAAYVRNNSVPVADLPNMIRSVHSTLGGLARGEGELVANGKGPAVPIKKSITRDYIICLEDGKRLKMLKRYLRTQFDLTPDEYRKKWNLPPCYPMTAPEYASRRSSIAKKTGLGGAEKKRRGR